MPETVQALYAAQLDDLPPAARKVARRALRRRPPVRGALPVSSACRRTPARRVARPAARTRLVDGPRAGPAWARATAIGTRSCVMRDMRACTRGAGHASTSRLARPLDGDGCRRARDVARRADRPPAGGSRGVHVGGHRASPGSTDRRDGQRVDARAGGRVADAGRGPSLALAAHDAAAALMRRASTLSDPSRRAGRGAGGSPPGRGPRVHRRRGGGRTSGSRTPAPFAALLDGPTPRPHGRATRKRRPRRSGCGSSSSGSRDARRSRQAAIAVLDPQRDRATIARLSRLRLVQAHAELFLTNDAGPAYAGRARVEAIARTNGDRELELDALRLQHGGRARRARTRRHRIGWRPWRRARSAGRSS